MVLSFGNYTKHIHSPLGFHVSLHIRFVRLFFRVILLPFLIISLKINYISQDFMNKIELTEEQKKCVEHPLDGKVLLIDADPGTGKTEILRHRVKFIYQQNKKERKFILVLAVGRNISKSIKGKLKKEGLKKIHEKLKTVLPEFFHKPQCEDIDDCLECLEKRSPIILTCTVHSIAY